jgi:hypothetical protein
MGRLSLPTISVPQLDSALARTKGEESDCGLVAFCRVRLTGPLRGSLIFERERGRDHFRAAEIPWPLALICVSAPCERASGEPDVAARRKLASRAFSLAQEAEATERAVSQPLKTVEEFAWLAALRFAGARLPGPAWVSIDPDQPENRPVRSP